METFIYIVLAIFLSAIAVATASVIAAVSVNYIIRAYYDTQYEKNNNSKGDRAWLQQHLKHLRVFGK